MAEIWTDEQIESDRQAYASQEAEIKRRYVGQYIAFSGGRVIKSGPDFVTVERAVAQLNPRPTHVMIFPAEDGSQVFEPVNSISSEYV